MCEKFLEKITFPSVSQFSHKFKFRTKFKTLSKNFRYKFFDTKKEQKKRTKKEQKKNKKEQQKKPKI